jgi:zinc finger CCHC domain-containing protein 9
MKKIHLSETSVQDRIEDLEAKLESIRSDPSLKKKKQRIFSQLSKLKKSLSDPSLRVDPELEKEMISKRQAKKRAKIQKLSEKHKIQQKLSKLPKDQSNLVCINCKSRGHVIKNCPLLDKREVYCYSCGSRTHTYKECEKTGFGFAVCFFCNGTGHLASQCSQNPNQGIYPKGGSCHKCGSVWHLAKNCDSG